jgi:hypothetical protein
LAASTAKAGADSAISEQADAQTIGERIPDFPFAIDNRS